MRTNTPFPCSKQPMKFILVQTGVRREPFSWEWLNAMVYSKSSAVTNPLLLNLKYPSRHYMLIITIHFQLVNGQCQCQTQCLFVITS